MNVDVLIVVGVVVVFIVLVLIDAVNDRLQAAECENGSSNIK